MNRQQQNSQLDINKLITNIIDFKNTNHINETVEEIKEKILKFYNLNNNMICNFGDIFVFRVRKVENLNQQFDSDSVWCPPPEFVNEVGRVNDIGERIFYGAFDPLTAIMETQVKTDDSFLLSIYFLKPFENNDKTSIVVNTPLPSKSTENDLYPKGYSYILSNFMVEEFTRNVNDTNKYHYKTTCALSKLLFGTNNKDSIIYPSVRNHDKGDIAIKEESARERLFLRSVLKCKLNRYTSENKAAIEISEVSNVGITDLELVFEKSPTNKEQIIDSNTWVNEEFSFKKLFHPNKLIEYHKNIESIFNAKDNEERRAIIIDLQKKGII
jgi:RES domain-containing protein